jgi:hypothetical protein
MNQQKLVLNEIVLKWYLKTAGVFLAELINLYNIHKAPACQMLLIIPQPSASKK